MTEKLKQILHERADRVDFLPPDLEALTSAGDRRVRNRRAAAAGGLAVLAVAGGLLVPRLVDGDDAGVSPTDRVDAASEVIPSASASYARGDTIFFEGGSIDVGHEVAAYVRTAIGYVVADPKGMVFSVTSAEVNPVGRTDPDRPRLVADDESVLAGWIDPWTEQPSFVVLTQDSLTTTETSQGTHAGMSTLPEEEDAAYFVGIDGGVAYWRDDRGLVASEVEVNTTVLDPSMTDGRGVLDVEDGLFAFDAGDEGTVLGTSRDDVTLALPGVYGSMGAFSPDAGFYSADADEPMVFDTGTGEPVTLDLDAGFATAFEWLDDTTAVVLASDRPAGDAQASLWTCTVPSGECELFAEDLGTFDELGSGGFALPTGERLGDG